MKKFPSKRRLNFSKQVCKPGYAKHLSEKERMTLLEAMFEMASRENRKK